MALGSPDSTFLQYHITTTPLVCGEPPISSPKMFRTRLGALSRHKTTQKTIRLASTAPIKSYTGLKNPASLIWHHHLPSTAKYFSGILAAAATISHVHPNTLVTIVPPVAVAGYFAARRINHANYVQLLALVRPRDAAEWADDDAKVRVWRYKEEDVATVLRGIENQYEHFQEQIVELVEQRVVDYVAAREQEGHETAVTRALLDENKQVAVHVAATFETFVSLQADVVNSEGNGAVVEFVRCSVPYYSSKNIQLRRRLGVAEVSLLQVPDKSGEATSELADYTDYKIWIDLTPYGFFSKCEGFGGLSGGIMSSKIHEVQKTGETVE